MEPDKGIEKVRESRKKISEKNEFDIHKLVQFYKSKQQNHKDRLTSKVDTVSRQ